MNDYVLTLTWLADKSNPIASEVFTGTALQAEQRLSEMWNDSLAAIRGEEFRATMKLAGTRHVLMQIGW